ncbi:hypothetical protein ACLILY_32435, partial [Mycobacterium sp. MS3]|uniref:hypothetical protein n=1 Tax=Mycobacterium sp. MS3 TaxID=3391378 RepID=UPI00398A4A04
TVRIEQIPVDFGLRVPLNFTLSGGTFPISTLPYTIGAINLSPLSAINNGSTIGPFNVPAIEISGPRLDLVVGGPGYTLFGGISGTVGPIDIPISIPAGPGIG